MSIEPRRLCGFRKVGGLYLVGRGMAMRCDRLPFPLNVCPTCRAGFKPARGWAWLDICALAGVHPACTDRFPCVFCMAPQVIGRCGLLWVGEKFYPTPDDFAREAMELGISRRIAAVPREFKLGETWVLLAHRRAVDCPNCGSRPADGI